MWFQSVFTLFTYLNKIYASFIMGYFGHYIIDHSGSWALCLGEGHSLGPSGVLIFMLCNGKLWVSATKQHNCPSSSPCKAESRAPIARDALIPGEKRKEENLRKGSRMPHFFSPSFVTIVSRFLGYQWPRKGHWASARFWWSSLKKDVSEDPVSS